MADRSETKANSDDYSSSGTNRIGEGLFMITDETNKKLQALYGLEYETSEQMIQAMNSGRPTLHPIARVIRITSGDCEYIYKRGGETLIRGLGGWLSDSFKDVGMLHLASAGVGVVLRAFQFQSDNTLYERMQRVNGSQLREHLNARKFNFIDRSNLRQNPLLAFTFEGKIPSYQFNLTSVIDRLAITCDGNVLREGAETCYSILDKFKEALELCPTTRFF